MAGAPLAAASQRAYLSDIRDIESWCQTVGIKNMAHIDAGQLFAYFVGLVRRGRASATLRRRLTAVRWYIENERDVKITSATLRHIEKRVLKGVLGHTGVLVVSEDSIIRAGLTAVLGDAGVLCWSENVWTLDPATLECWDYVLVWIRATKGVDAYGAIEVVRGVDPEITARVPIIAVYSGPVSTVVQLRLSEAGARYFVPHTWLSDNITDLSRRLASADVPLRYHLETPFALRQHLGLSLGGDLGELLDAADLVPVAVWTHDLPQEKLPIARSDILHLRRVGLEKAGIPVPEEGRYSTAFRLAPLLPNWTTIRRIVREAWGIGPARSDNP
ncbi:site-specific integrase [Cryobacterium glaciale]|uniref:site-specific integrase n=1 Tax=Cryobacterium glaciale TaxID=1259145 RepID=UPI00141BD769|nr:site-specific integrase [Cryobacterium glaciale]